MKKFISIMVMSAILSAIPGVGMFGGMVAWAFEATVVEDVVYEETVDGEVYAIDVVEDVVYDTVEDVVYDVDTVEDVVYDVEVVEDVVYETVEDTVYDTVQGHVYYSGVSADVFALVIEEKTASVFGVIKENDVEPIIRNDRTMLPARFVAENLGATVEWDAEARVVTVKSEAVEIKLTIDSAVATVNGVEATFRVDPTYADDEQFAAINSLLQIVAEGTEFTYTGVVIAYSSSEVTPQILILNEKDLNFGEISDEDLLKAASGKLDIVTSIGFAVNTIDLPTTIEGFDCEVIWDTDSELIDPTTGVVKHGQVDERVTVIATIVLNGKSVQKEFFVTVEALDEKVYETLVSLDLEDALAPNSWGNSETKPSYAAAVVELGTPKAKWLLQNALIACTNNDKYNGSLGIRAQVRDSAAETARIEIMESGEYNVVEFAACIYGNDVLGTKIRIEYTFNDGATWEASENIITVNNTVLETFRVKLPEGAKRVAIVLVEGSGRRVNFDDIKLMK